MCLPVLLGGSERFTACPRGQFTHNSELVDGNQVVKIWGPVLCFYKNSTLRMALTFLIWEGGRRLHDTEQLGEINVLVISLNTGPCIQLGCLANCVGSVMVAC